MSDYDYTPEADLVRSVLSFDPVLRERAKAGDRRALAALDRIDRLPEAMLLPEPSWPCTISSWVATYPLSREAGEEFGDWCVRMCLQMGMSLYEAITFVKDAAR